MNIDNLKNTWQQQDETIEASVQINQQTLSKMDEKKHKNRFFKITILRAFESLVFFVAIVSLWVYIANNFVLSAATVSACILNIFAIIGLIGSVGQLVLIAQLDYSKPVNILQKQVLSICSHELQFTKLMFMSAPFYLAYVILGFDVFFDMDFYSVINPDIMKYYLISSLIFLILVLIMAVKLNYKNISTPWVRWTIQLLLGKQLVEMSGIVNNLEQSQT